MEDRAKTIVPEESVRHLIRHLFAAQGTPNPFLEAVSLSCLTISLAGLKKLPDWVTETSLTKLCKELPNDHTAVDHLITAKVIVDGLLRSDLWPKVQEATYHEITMRRDLYQISNILYGVLMATAKPEGGGQ